MQKLSRRQLAKYAADQLLAGQPVRKLAAQLAAVLSATKRGGQAPQLAEDIAFELESRGALATATITSAHPLSEQLSTELEKFIKHQTGARAVAATQAIDPAVIGGVRIDTASRSWDQTIRRRLTDIREAF
jgi:F-type H+-transporting ATPase subunit delta